jgi:deazaflavin-dependent oxidoreductase (nitroreductase family)
VREQVEAYESSGGSKANTLRDTGLPIIVVTMIGHSSGKVRKIALMRVTHDGEYALVASKGGAPEHPVWYSTLKHLPDVMIQDGDTPHRYTLRELDGAERQEWWDRAVEAYPPYAEYQERATNRTIPVLLATAVGDDA